MDRVDILVDIVSNVCPSPLIGVEIGVARGTTSAGLLDFTNVGKLYAIDPYVKKPRRASVARRRLLHKKYKERCTMLLMTSKKASRSVPRDLDFVFIDGDHSYEAVKLDLNIWFDKLKSNGLLIGHDWIMCSDIGSPFNGLRRAVQEFTSINLERISLGELSDYDFRFKYSRNVNTFVNETEPNQVSDGFFWFLKKI